MPIILQFNDLTHNETARKAMESYTGILQKAFEHYQNLWEDYIKLQEKCGQCNIHSSQMAVNTSCTKNETISHLNANIEENNRTPLLELDTINISPVNFNSDTETSLSDANECLHKNTDEDNRAESPIFCKTFLKTGNNSAKKFVRSSKAIYNNSSSDMKTHHDIEKVSSKYNHKLEINTTHHVETTFLPSGKRLKQSRLAFCPVKSNEKISSSSYEDKHKTANISHNVERNFIGDISIANTASTTVIENHDASNISELSEDVIEISPTQRTITSKVRRCLKLKKKIPIKSHIKKVSPNKCLGPNTVSEIIEDIDFGLCPSPKHISTQIKDSKSLTNIAVNTLKDKVNTSYLSPIKYKTDSQIKKCIEARKDDQLLINEVQKNKVFIRSTSDLVCKDETFYLPAEQAANRSNIDNFNLDDTENKSPEKKILDKFNVLSKKKADISRQLNMRCKADRAKLNGWDCWECREVYKYAILRYYKNLLLSKEELQKRKNQCSRHRHKYERPNTPEGFWNPEFPETLSCTYQQNKN